MLDKPGTHTGPTGSVEVRRARWLSVETRGAWHTQRREGLKGLCCQAGAGGHCKGHQGPWAQGKTPARISDGELTSARPGGRGESNQPGKQPGGEWSCQWQQ